MILYMCRYAPVEILEAMGAETEYFESEGGGSSIAEAYLHSNTCSFTKAVFEGIMSRQEFEGVLFTSCCDSSRRLHDALCRMFSEKFVHIVELPVYRDEAALSLSRYSVRAPMASRISTGA